MLITPQNSNCIIRMYCLRMVIYKKTNLHIVVVITSPKAITYPHFVSSDLSSINRTRRFKSIGPANPLKSAINFSTPIL